MQRPDFFDVLPRDRFLDLKGRYMKSPEPADGSFKHIELSNDQRDFLRSASCQKLSGDCNPFTSELSYQKGDYVPPEDLGRIWSGKAAAQSAAPTPTSVLGDTDGLYARLNRLVKGVRAFFEADSLEQAGARPRQAVKAGDGTAAERPPLALANPAKRSRAEVPAAEASRRSRGSSLAFAALVLLIVAALLARRRS